MASMFKNRRTTFERIEKFLSDKYFTDVNLTKLMTVDTIPLSDIYHLNLSTNPKLSTEFSLELQDMSALVYNDVILKTNEWNLVDPKTFSFGLTWSIHWFRLRFVVPHEWLTNCKHTPVLQWNSGCEVLVFCSGQIITGLNGTHSRTDVPISQLAPVTGNNYEVYLQISCSDLFGAGDGGLINAPDGNKTFQISSARLRLIFQPCLDLSRDLQLLYQIAEELRDTERGYRALYCANGAINAIVDLKCDSLTDKTSRAQGVIDQFFLAKNGTSQVMLHAIGHCHIDTAWLWRYGETRRKTARSWSTTANLLEKFPEMTFVCSQAQQLDWLRQDQPYLFHRLRQLHQQKHNGEARRRFLPVGGTWVEMDVNLPCCESLCRQFLYGQRFFRTHFGAYCTEFWLPDTFGYSPQLPQIMQLAGISRFVTQKLSWSLVNKFPHHTFLWTGLDGSTVVTHFPPGDSYSMAGKVSEMIHSSTNFADKGRSSSVMYVYGHGDGGQGPTEEMLHALNRLADCNGLPRICHSSPDEFFSKVERDDLNNLCRWRGELFLELHNGTYTTQRQLKLGNAHCEQMLKAVEMLTSIANCSPGTSKNGGHQQALAALLSQMEIRWKMVLLGQFHDVLPGSSIEQVNDDTFWSHRAVLSWCKDAIGSLASILDIAAPFFINPLSWPITVSLANGLMEVPAFTIQSLSNVVAGGSSVKYMFDETSMLHQLSNRYFEMSVDKQCRVQKLLLANAPELGNLIPGDFFANQLVLYDDVPLFWDAWDVMDYHLETGTTIESLPSWHLLQEALVSIDDQGVSLVSRLCLSATGTVIEQSVTVKDHLPYALFSTKVEKWNENHRLLKVKIATVANAVEAQWRTQAGFHSRPTHRNTSWDAAKYELCGHEWICVGEANWAIAVLKDAIFGSSVEGGTVFLSLLRAPTSPDATADRKYLPHIFSYAVHPHLSLGQPHKFATITRLASQFTWMNAHMAQRIGGLDNQSLPAHQTSRRSFPIFLESPNGGEVAIDWIKPSCDNPWQFIVRLHEQIGGRHLAKLSSSVPIKDAWVTNILEERDKDATDLHCTNQSIGVFMLPFKIISILVEFYL